MSQTGVMEVDYLAQATGGRLHWNDPGMADFEAGWEDFPLGTRVEVRTKGNVWRKGTVVETPNENERAIVVECDERYHDDEKFYGGRGATVFAYMVLRRDILSCIRTIDEPRREVVVPRCEPAKLDGMRAELLRIAEIAVQHSGGRLRLAYNEEDSSEKYSRSAARFLKLDGRRIGRDIELYGFMGDSIMGWEQALLAFFGEVLFWFKGKLPKSYEEAAKVLLKLGESVYGDDEESLRQWRELLEV